MRVLILGLSDIARRRVVPALRALGQVQGIDVATRKARDGTPIEWPDGRVYDDYAAALRQTDAELVYVSLVNSEHGRWADCALRQGLHVVVDKPAFLGLGETERMLELADRQSVCLAEAIVVGYHPQVRFLREQWDAARSAPRRVSATLSFPPMDPANFRYRRALGGGALWDLGPYASAVGRLFYGEEPEYVAAQVLARGGPDDVDIAFSIMATYTAGRSVVGHFGFDTVYCNRVDVIGLDLGVEMDRFFTTLPNVPNEVRVTTRQGSVILTAPAGDGFERFFGHLLESIASRSWLHLASDMHADARTVERLRRAAGEL